MSKSKNFDCIIIGAGPAGLTAGIYCARAGMSTVIIEESAVGGQIVQSKEIDNFPGFRAISGYELAEKMYAHAQGLGVEFLFDSIDSVEFGRQQKEVYTLLNGKIVSKVIIIATGARARKLEIDREEEFLGKGINFCATCDGMFYRNKNVVVVGGGNAGVEEAIALAGQAKKVTMVTDIDKLLTNKSRIERIKAQKNLNVIYNSTVTKILGDDIIEGFEVTSKNTGKVSAIKADGIFVSIGRTPSSDFLKGKLKTDKAGYIKVDANLQTSEPGVFAAGDIRKKILRQIIVSCSDGALAADSAHRYITN